MKILFLGEIIGRTGRQIVKKVLPEIKKKYKVDLCLANGETITHGKGVSREKVEEIVTCGVDFLTSGNHVFRYSNFLEDLDDPALPILRPANYVSSLPGRGCEILDLGRKGRVLLINLQGRVFMPHQIDSPFEAADRILTQNSQEKLAAAIVDFHAEATSEKQSLGYFLDGKVSAVFGTHTHVATADQRILPQKTAYVSDIGMIGSLNSILGGEITTIVSQQQKGMLGDFEVASDPPFLFNSVLIEINKGKAETIERIDRIVKSL